MDPIYELLDHRYLNEVDGLDNPTSENLARWLWQRLKPALPELGRVTVTKPATRDANTKAGESSLPVGLDSGKIGDPRRVIRRPRRDARARIATAFAKSRAQSKRHHLP